MCCGNAPFASAVWAFPLLAFALVAFTVSFPLLFVFALFTFAVSCLHTRRKVKKVPVRIRYLTL